MLGKSLCVSLCLLSVFGYCYADPNPVSGYVPCKPDDSPCLQRAAKLVIGHVLKGIPSIGIEAAEPIYVDVINADVAGLKYNFSKVYARGFSNCEINNVKLDLSKSNVKFDFLCVLNFRGDYVMKGRLIVLPVEGDGNFEVQTGKINLAVDAELAQVKGKDGKDHFSIKKFTVEPIPLEPVHFDFKNLFNGNKQLSDGIHKFANENSEQVTKELSGPLFTATFKTVIKNLNKYYKSVTVTDLLIL